jgi:polyadenylation factor subunit 2
MFHYNLSAHSRALCSDIHFSHSHKSTINACNWNPDGHLVATAGGDGTIRLFDIRTFRELEAMKGHTKEVNCASIFMF